jgi:hypothetical protein
LPGLVRIARGRGGHHQTTSGAAVNTPISVASAINIPTDFGHHAWVVDIQPQVNAPHR